MELWPSYAPLPAEPRPSKLARLITAGAILGILALASALMLALIIGLHLPESGEGRRYSRRRDFRIALILWIIAAAVDSTYSMHRHYAFGSGSWDLGCMVHNVYRASHFLNSTSTVLG